MCFFSFFSLYATYTVNKDVYIKQSQEFQYPLCWNWKQNYCLKLLTIKEVCSWLQTFRPFNQEAASSFTGIHLAYQKDFAFLADLENVSFDYAHSEDAENVHEITLSQ